MDPVIKDNLVAGGIDLDEGIDRFGGNEAMFEKFIRRFINDENLEKLRLAIEKENAEEAFHHAHTLKGVVGNLSFGSYYAAVTELAEELNEGSINRAKELMPVVEDAHQKVIGALETF